MRAHERTEEREPTDEAVLAAVRRARAEGPAHWAGAPLWALREQLALPPRSARARRMRERVAELERSGMLERSRSRGLAYWSLSGAGRARLAAAERSDAPPRLPESPCSRARARALGDARRELPGLLARFAEHLAEAAWLLGAEREAAPGATRADRWESLGRALLADCERIGSASRALHEPRERV